MERKQEQDTTDDRQKQGNPADETVIYKIGGTFYEVSTSCGGSEPLFEKMKRLIKSENLKAPTDIVNIGLHFFLKNVRPYAASCSEA